MSQKNDQRKERKHAKQMETAIRQAIANSQERVRLCEELVQTLQVLDEDLGPAQTALTNAQLNHAGLLCQVLGVTLADEPEEVPVTIPEPRV